MDVVMVGDGVVVVPVWCYLSLCFSFINLGFVVCYLISEFHKSRFCGVLFDFCKFGLWFLSSGFLISYYVLQVFFFFGKISMFFGLISVGSGFWFLCNCVLQIFFCCCSLCASDPKSPDSSNSLIRLPEPPGPTKCSSSCGYILCSPDLTWPMDSPNKTFHNLWLMDEKWWWWPTY